jgi:hypothetical protein
LGYSKRSTKRNVYSFQCLKQKEIKNKLVMHLKFLEKQEQPKPKINRWEKIIKIRFSISEIETKKYMQRINKAGSQWLMPAILATQEAEIRRVVVQSQSQQIVQEILS